MSLRLEAYTTYVRLFKLSNDAMDAYLHAPEIHNPDLAKRAERIRFAALRAAGRVHRRSHLEHLAEYDQVPDRRRYAVIEYNKAENRYRLIMVGPYTPCMAFVDFPSSPRPQELKPYGLFELQPIEGWYSCYSKWPNGLQGYGLHQPGCICSRE